MKRIADRMPLNLIVLVTISALVCCSFGCTSSAADLGTLPSLSTPQAAPKPAPTPEAQSEVVARIAADFHHAHIGLEVKINDEGPFWFQLDTGSSAAVTIDRSLARKLNLARLGMAISDDGTGTNVEKALVRVDDVSLGGISFGIQEALEDDYSWISRERPVLGLLGMPLFRDLLLHIDYPAGVIELTHGRLDPGNAKTVRFESPPGIQLIPIQIGADPMRAVIDTGSQDSLVFPVERMEEIATQGRPIRVGRAVTVNSEYDVYGAQLVEPVRVAGHSLKGVQVMFMEVDIAVIGFELLKNFRLTLDQAGNLVRFTLPRESPKGTLTDGAG